jgi:type I restriction enzyme S subunit
MNHKTGMPQLRFLGFDGEWKFEKFGKIATNKSGKFNPIKESSFTKCIELEHLGTETGQLLGYIDGSNSGSIKNKFDEGDILFGKLRPYLKKYLQAPFQGVCSSEIWVLKGVKITNSFLYQIVQTNKFIDLANQSSGSKMPRADWNVVENCVFTFPTLPEQQKIASFLSAVDEKIQQLSRKKELLEQYKKGVMQQLFSGKLRFKDENGNDYADWEEKKLGDVFYVVRGNGISKDKLSQDGTSGCILYGELYTKYKEVIFKVISRTDSTEGVLSSIGDLLIPSSTTTTGIDLANITALNEEKILLGGDITILRTKRDISNVFFAYYLTNYKKFEIAAFAQGSTIVHLSYNHFKVLMINFPSKEEQQKIANFLSSIDAKIESANQQIAQTQCFKKGLLQQLFV